MEHLPGNIQKMLDYWADPIVHLHLATKELHVLTTLN